VLLPPTVSSYLTHRSLIRRPLLRTKCELGFYFSNLDQLGEVFLYTALISLATAWPDVMFKQPTARLHERRRWSQPQTRDRFSTTAPHGVASTASHVKKNDPAFKRR